MFYARCARMAVEYRRSGMGAGWALMVWALNNPIVPMDDYANACYAGDGGEGSPLFPIGQLDVPSWILCDIDY